MKGKRLILALVSVILTMVTALGVAACGKNDEKPIGPYYAEYGQEYVLPDLGGEVSVTDADGNEVTVTDGRFLVDKTTDYTIVVKAGKITYRGTIVVQKREVPTIYSSSRIVYGTVNTAVALPEVSASADGASVDVVATMKKGETAIDITGGFTPDEVGEYTYVLTATNGSKTVTETIPVYIEEADGWTKKIASFDKPYGVNHIREDYGISASYTSEIRYGTEAGSTKVTIDSSEAKSEAMFAFSDLHIKDWTNVEGVKMYVYTDNTLPSNFMFNWGTGYTTLMPNKWAQVFVSKADIGKLKNINIDGDLDLTSMDGINVEVISPINGHGKYNIYFSAFYVAEKDVVTTGEVKEMISEFVGLTEFDRNKKEALEIAYNSLTDEEKNTVKTEYDAYEGKMQLFVDAEKQKLAEAGENTEGVLVYTDREFGQFQMSNLNSLTSYTERIKYGEEAGSTAVQGYGFYLDARLRFPTAQMAYNVDKIEFAVYNANSKIYYAVAFNPDGSEQIALAPRAWTKISLDYAYATSLEKYAALIQIYSGNWSQGIEKDCPKFYFSQIRMKYSPITTAAEFKNFINGLDGELTDENADLVKRYYAMLPEAEKSAAESDYNAALKNYYLTRDGVDTAAANRITYFDSEFGTTQIVNTNSSKVRYVYSTEERYGDEKGSLLIEAGSQWFAKFGFVNVEGDLSKYDYLQFYVKYKNTENNENLTAMVFKANGAVKEIPLKYNEWTLVTLKLTNGGFTEDDGSPSDTAFVFSRVDYNNNGMDLDIYRFYVSAVYGVPKLNITTGAALDEHVRSIGSTPSEVQVEQIIDCFNSLSVDEQTASTVAKPFVKKYYLDRDGVDTKKADRLTYFDSEYGKLQIVNTNSSKVRYVYSTEERYGDEKGSLLIEAGSQWFAKFGFVNVEGDLSKYDYLQFYVKYKNTENNENLTAMVFKANGAVKEIPLKYNEWTLVTLKLTNGGFTEDNGNPSDTAFVFSRVDYNNHGIDQDIYRFYVSAVYGVPKLNVSTANELKAYMDEVETISFADGYRVISAYDALADEEKANITVGELKKFYLARDGVNTAAANRLTYFDSEYGKSQVKDTSTPTVSYTTVAYGNESGSLRLQNAGGYWDNHEICIAFTGFEEQNLSDKYSAIEFYVYNDNDWGVNMQVYFNFGGEDGFENTANFHGEGKYTSKDELFIKNADGNKLNVGAKKWTKITVPVTDDRIDYRFVFQQWDNAGDGISGDSYKLCFSAVYGVPKA